MRASGVAAAGQHAYLKIRKLLPGGKRVRVLELRGTVLAKVCEKESEVRSENDRGGGGDLLLVIANAVDTCPALSKPGCVTAKTVMSYTRSKMMTHPSRSVSCLLHSHAVNFFHWARSFSQGPLRFLYDESVEPTMS